MRRVTAILGGILLLAVASPGATAAADPALRARRP